jgi:hypothetical protein
MSTPASPYTWTYSEYARFPDDGNRYEVIDGEVLVTPAPTPHHQHVMATLLIALRTYVERFGLGVVLPDGHPGVLGARSAGGVRLGVALCRRRDGAGARDRAVRVASAGRA